MFVEEYIEPLSQILNIGSTYSFSNFEDIDITPPENSIALYLVDNEHIPSIEDVDEGEKQITKLDINRFRASLDKGQQYIHTLKCDIRSSGIMSNGLKVFIDGHGIKNRTFTPMSISIVDNYKHRTFDYEFKLIETPDRGEVYFVRCKEIELFDNKSPLADVSNISMTITVLHNKRKKGDLILMVIPIESEAEGYCGVELGGKDLSLKGIFSP